MISNTKHLEPNEDKSYSADNLKAVVDSDARSVVKFIGTHEECCNFLRTETPREHDCRDFDLRYIKDGQLWRMSSYVL